MIYFRDHAFFLKKRGRSFWVRFANFENFARREVERFLQLCNHESAGQIVFYMAHLWESKLVDNRWYFLSSLLVRTRLKFYFFIFFAVQNCRVCVRRIFCLIAVCFRIRCGRIIVDFTIRELLQVFGKRRFRVQDKISWIWAQESHVHLPGVFMHEGCKIW